MFHVVQPSIYMTGGDRLWGPFTVVHFCSWAGILGGISLCTLARDAKENAPSKACCASLKAYCFSGGAEEACAHE